MALVIEISRVRSTIAKKAIIERELKWEFPNLLFANSA